MLQVYVIYVTKYTSSRLENVLDGVSLKEKSLGFKVSCWVIALLEIFGRIQL